MTNSNQIIKGIAIGLQQVIIVIVYTNIAVFFLLQENANWKADTVLVGDTETGCFFCDKIIMASLRIGIKIPSIIKAFFLSQVLHTAKFVSSKMLNICSLLTRPLTLVVYLLLTV